MPKNSSGELYFQADSRLLEQLGAQLVANRTTALAELIKNCYDADATIVTVDFVDQHRGGMLVIRDNGTGMSLEDLKQNWMVLSTANKEIHPVSDAGRLRAGKKGIGRFAAHSLGRKLTLASNEKTSNTCLVATFDWDRFSQPPRRAMRPLEAIASRYRTVRTSRNATGTVLRIRGLREHWSDKDLEEVKRAILLLQAPPPVAKVYRKKERKPESDRFEVKISIGRTMDDWADPETITEGFLSAATAVVTATVDSNGVGSWRVRSERYDLDEVTAYDRPVLTTGCFTLEASYFIHRAEAIGDVKVKLSKEMGARFGGIRVYRDKLRVAPYGDPGNDWLHLDGLSRSRTILFPVSNNNWFGHISISREHNLLLVDTASREGVIENEAFEELKLFSKAALLSCGRTIANVRAKKAEAKTAEPPGREARSVLIVKAKSIAAHSIAVAATGGEPAGLDALEEGFEGLEREAQEYDRGERNFEKSILTERSLLRVLASLGTSIVVFGHEVKSAINTARARLVDLQEDIEDLGAGQRERLLSGISDGRDSIGRLDQLANYIDGYASRSRVRETSRQPLHSVFREFAEVFGPVAGARSTKIEWSVEPRNLRTPAMARTELDAILINLLTNSLKALEGSPRSRMVLLSAQNRDEDHLVVRFQDTGRGIPRSHAHRVFEPFFSTSTSSDGSLGTGTGLGLKIVHDIVSSVGGSVSVSPPDAGFSTCIELVF